jgi:hypothetical protein
MSGNRTKRIGKAYLDDDLDPTIEADLDIEGGVADEAICHWVKRFHRATAQFLFSTLSNLGD